MTDSDPRIDFFDRLAGEWDNEYERLEETLHRLHTLLPTLGLQAGQSVLEVGCGTGQITAWLAQQVRPGRVTAVDFSPRMLDEARARGVDAEFRCLDVCGDPLPCATYDVIWCKHVFPHFRDQAAALANLAGALRADGRMIILHMDNWRAINAMHDRCEPVVQGDYIPDPAAWRKLLRDARLDVVEWLDRSDLFCLKVKPAGA